MVARLDDTGEVLLTGPAVRAVAAHSDRVTFLAGIDGAAAAALLPGVDSIWTFDAPWVGPAPPDTERHKILSFVDRVADTDIDLAIILTSHHHSALPLALLLRMAGVDQLVGISADSPGSLLDVRVPLQPQLHEVQQALTVCAAAGFELPSHDHGALDVRLDQSTERLPPKPYVVIHPGASVPARALPAEAAALVAAALANEGWHIVVAGTVHEAELAARVAAPVPAERLELRIGCSDLSSVGHLLAHADALICGNTWSAHLAAAVGTPVVQAFAPVVPLHRGRPWQVPQVVLGKHNISCAGCQARVCPIPGQPCLEPFGPNAVVTAVNHLVRRSGVVRRT
jgi:ADP-heptose:LPS heptosyltransferase